MNARPLWLPRRAALDTRLEMDSEIGPDASRTFGPSPRPCMVCASAWAFVLVSCIAVVCALVHVAARLA